MTRTRKSNPRTWSLYPNLHNKVSKLLREDNLVYSFNEIDDEDACTRSYDTNVMGRFICHNQSCTSQGWSSKVIPITIRLYEGQQYNARIYYQRCARCQSLSRPILNALYAERIAYRIKKWAGIDVETPVHVAQSLVRPHRSNLCEACKAGRCKEIQD